MGGDYVLSARLIFRFTQVQGSWLLNTEILLCYLAHNMSYENYRSLDGIAQQWP